MSSMARILRMLLFLSTPSARRATENSVTTITGKDISIHALREEGDSLLTSSFVPPLLFLSTPSARRATQALTRSGIEEQNFYPRPPRGGRLITTGRYWQTSVFLSTPSARRATRQHSRICRQVIQFLSTPSARRATRCPCCFLVLAHISIHALREEGDNGYEEQTSYDKIFLSTPSARRATRGKSGRDQRALNFYPRPPRGGRQFSKYFPWIR